jgi:hypothetical protein
MANVAEKPNPAIPPRVRKPNRRAWSADSAHVLASRQRDAEERLFSAVERVKQEVAGNSQVSRELLEEELLPAMREAATAHVRSGVSRLPPGADREDVISFIDERFVRMLRSMKLSMDAPQIITWIYSSIRHAVLDAQRAQDNLSRRQRELAVEANRVAREMEERLKRPVTESERRQIAMDVLGKYRASSKSASQLATLITDEVQTQGIEFAEAIAGTSDTEAEAEAELEAQALTIAGANLDDDEAFVSFADMITGGEITNAGFKAGVRAAVLHQLIEFGFDQPETLDDTRGKTSERKSNRRDASPVRPLRYYVFDVPGWGAQHDQVIDAAAEAPLEMPIAIDHAGDVVRVFAAENPEPLWGVRRWRLLAIVLAFPDLSMRRAWIPLAMRIRDQLPGAVSMRILTRSMFEGEIRRLVELATPARSGLGEARVFVAKRLARPGSVPRHPAPGMKRSRVRITALPLAAGIRLIPNLPASPSPPDRQLVIVRDKQHSRYVVTDGLRGQTLFNLPSELTSLLDAEFADGAKWEIGWWWRKRIPAPSLGRDQRSGVADQRWASQFVKIQDFVRTNGRLPDRQSRDKTENNLAQSLRYQRERYRVGTLSPERIADCESLPGWTWGSKNDVPRIQKNRPRKTTDEWVVFLTLRRTSPRHGLPGTYRNHGCKCEKCTRAKSESQAAWRKHNSDGKSKSKTGRESTNVTASSAKRKPKESIGLATGSQLNR